MLEHLSIRNYALIQSLDLKFERGFTVLTGETGSGKSILLGALGLALGNRADTSVLFDQNAKCVVEATFSVKKALVKEWFTENDLDFEDPLIIRREINANGKSRAFVNDTPVQLGQLKSLAVQLVDIHSQHETLFLNQGAYQLRVLDHFADNIDLLDTCAKLHSQWQNLTEKLETFERRQNEAALNLDYLQFQLDEILALNLQPGEIKEIEEEMELLEHSGEIKNILREASTQITDRDENLISILDGLGIAFERLKSKSESLSGISERLKSVKIELSDIEQTISELNVSMDIDPRRAEYVQERMAAINQILHKHRLNSSEDVLVHQEKLENEISGIGDLDKEVSSLKKQISDTFNQLISLSEQLSQNRLKVIPGLEKKVTKLLGEMSMPEALLKVNLIKTATYSASGDERSEFLFKTNKGSNMMPLQKILSGGEMSRLMLAIKSLLTEKAILPTLILDEIDAGVSGKVATRMGKIMEQMGTKMQLIAITHLPQIAAKGKSHYIVEKSTLAGKTSTMVKELESDERIVAIAQMLSGEKTTQSSVANAKDLLGN